MSGSSDNNSSTLKSYVDGAVGMGQNALGSLTGNSATKDSSAEHKASADQQKQDSHTVGRMGPLSATPEGGLAADDPSRQEGSWNQTLGSGKSALGGLVGSESLKKEGDRQYNEGKGQEAEGQVRDFGEGVKGRVGGAVGGMVAGVTGDKDKEEKERLRHDDAKARQRGVEAELQKQSDA